MAQRWFEYIAPLVLGIALGVVLFKGMAAWATKWFYFAVAAVFGLSLLALLRLFSREEGRRRGLLFLGVFSLPMLFVDVNFGFVYDYPYTVLANGYNVGLSDVLFGILFLGWIADLWRGRVRWFFPRSLLLIFVFGLAVNLISALFIAREPFFAYSLIWRQLKAYWLVLFLSNYLKDADDFKVIGYAFAGVLIFEGLVVLEQKTLGVIFTAERLGYQTGITSRAGAGTIERIAGTLGHPNTLAAFLNTALIWVWFMVPAEARLQRRVLLMIALLLGLGALMSTGSRGGWLGLAVAVGGGMWFWLRKQGKNPLIGMGVVVLTVSLGFGSLFAVSETFRVRLTKGDAGSAEVRKPLMEVAFNVIRARPWTGVGLGQYVQSMLLYDRSLLRVASWYNQPVHNAFLLKAAETGLPGGLFLVLLVLALIRHGWWVFGQSEGVFADAGLTAVLATLAWTLQQQANPDNLHMATILWVVYGAMLAARRRLLLERDAVVPSGVSIPASATPTPVR